MLNYLKRIADAVEDITGESIAVENENEAGYLLRIATATELLASASRGALVGLNATLVGLDFTAGGTINWTKQTARSNDVAGVWNSGVNPNRLSVPTGFGIREAKVSTSISFTGHTSDLWLIATIRKNGTHDWEFGGAQTSEVGLTGPRIYCATPWVPVVPGTDYFDMRIDAETDTSIDVGANRSWMEIEFR